MNPFKSIAIIIKALNDRYFTSKQDEIDQQLRANALMMERRYKSRLQQQLNEIVISLKTRPNIYAVKISVAEECIQYLPEVLKVCECELTQLSEGIYLLKLKEEEII